MVATGAAARILPLSVISAGVRATISVVLRRMHATDSSTCARGTRVHEESAGTLLTLHVRRHVYQVPLELGSGAPTH